MRRVLQWLKLDNERGQLNLSGLTNLLRPIGSQLLSTGTNLFTNRLLGLNQRGVNLGGFTLPNNLLGGGLLLGGSLLDKEPGGVLEARQSVRNLLTPESQTGQFAAQVRGLESQFQPLLTQQRQQGIADIGRRYAAAFPGTVGAQGPEFGGLARYLTQEALPHEQALIGNLGLQGLQMQLGAGRTLLETARPDPFAQALSQFGGLLLARDLLIGGGGGVGGQGGTTLLDQRNQPIGTVTADGSLLPISGQGLGGFQLNPLQIGQLWRLPNGQVVQVNRTEAEALSAAGIGSPATGAGGGLGTLGNGLLGASVGIPAGTAIGQRIAVPGSNAPLIGSGAGALIGSLLGTAIAPGVGTAIGTGLGGTAGGTLGGAAKQPDISRKETIQGALGGLFGGVGSFLAAQGDVSTSHAVKEAALVTGATILGGPLGGVVAGAILGRQRGAQIEKTKFRREDVDSHRDQVQEVGSFLIDELAQAGGDATGFGDFVRQQMEIVEQGASPFDFQGISGTLDQQLAVSKVGGTLLLRAIQSQHPAITSLDQVPGLRSRFIDYLTRSTTSAGNSAFGGGPPLDQFPRWFPGAGGVQLARGGVLRSGTALVGEAGPEWLTMTPQGAFVMPLLLSRN